MELAERLHATFGSRAEPVHFSSTVREKLAFNLRHDFESRNLRLAPSPELTNDLHALKQQVTDGGNIRLDGGNAESHCDRFWAKALRQEAARSRPAPIGILVC